MRRCLASGNTPERAHVVQAVGELDQQHADVAGHRHDHLADVLGLLLLARAELEPVELREAVDDARDLLAELLFDGDERDVGVLHGVVEERGLEGGGVQPQVRQDRGDRHGMFDEVLARLALLPLVRVLGERERPLRSPSGRPSGCRTRTFFRTGSIRLGGAGVAAAQPRARDVRQPATPPRLSRRRRCLLLVEGDFFPAVHVLPPVRPVYGGEAGWSGTPCAVSTWIRVWNSWSLIFSRPLRKSSSIMHAMPHTLPPACSTRDAAAAAVPPVASTSSTIRTRSPGLMPSRCSSIVAVPYSSSYSSAIVSDGSLPALRMGTKPAPKW